MILDSAKRNRRTSAQTDISIHTDSESDLSESETELSRTRSGGKSDESEVKTYKRKVKPTTQSNVSNFVCFLHVFHSLNDFSLAEIGEGQRQRRRRP